MKPADKYLKFVLWDERDQAYVGYCPDLFPWGGICHAVTEDDAYKQLLNLVEEEVEDLRQEGKELPPACTRAMREAVPV